MEVTRTQYSVGQGCFHAGQIQWRHDFSESPEEFNYVYDCGSSDGSTALKHSISNWRSQTSRLDSLFVSHLDADHVNGIDRLLCSVNAESVYIPYVDVAAEVLQIIADDLEDALTASLIEARLDPRSWFGRRGVARIVRVRPPPDEPIEQDSPLSHDEPLGTKPESASRKTPTHRPTLETMYSGELVIVNPGQRVRWAFVPHVDPTPEARRKDFYRQVRQALGLAPRQRLMPDRLATALRNTRQRRLLKQCYEQIIAGGSTRLHNRASMSLYSGPADTGHRTRNWSHQVMSHSAGWAFHKLHLQTYPYWPGDRTAVGWLGTGDAQLDRKDVRVAWRQTFDPFRHQVSTLLLPHHGSRHNFHVSLLDWPDLCLCVCSAADPSQYQHPDLEVIGKVLGRAKIMHHVSQQPDTKLREQIRLL